MTNQYVVNTNNVRIVFRVEIEVHGDVRGWADWSLDNLKEEHLPYLNRDMLSMELVGLIDEAITVYNDDKKERQTEKL